MFASKRRKYKLFPRVNRRVVPGLSRLSKSLCVQSLCAFFLPYLRQEKRAQRLTFWVRRPPGGVGVFHAKGWWPKTSCPPSKLCLPWVSKRGIRDVPGILPGCPGPLAVFKKFVQKNFVCFFPALSESVCGCVPDFTPEMLNRSRGTSNPWMPATHRQGKNMDKYMDKIQGALKGTNLRGQTEPKRKFLLISADFGRFSSSPRIKTKHLGNADFHRKPQIFAGKRRFSREPAENRRLAFVPLGLSLKCGPNNMTRNA